MSRGYVPFIFYELRPTNNVLLYDRIVEVIGTRITEIDYLVSTKPLYSEEINDEVDVKIIQGIPLSPLMIKQLAVPMVDSNYKDKGFRISGGFKNIWNLFHHIESPKCDSFVKEIHYVHQLQNFIFEMDRTMKRIPFHFYQHHQSHLDIAEESLS